MSTELALYNLSDMQTMADAIAQSGLFGMKNNHQALALMLVAQSEHRHPATITQDYDIIQNKACRKTHSVMARFQQMGGKVEWHELTEQKADATFSHPAGGSLRIDWTFEQAKKAGLTGKDNWKNYPRSMLRARCIAEGIRAVYPAAIGGMLVAEEAQDIGNETPVEPANKPATPTEKVVEGETLMPDYPEQKYTDNLPTWVKYVAAGKKTPGDLIASIQSMYALSAAQIAGINAIPEFISVRNALNVAVDMIALDAIAERVGAVNDPTLRAELGNVYDARRIELQS